MNEVERSEPTSAMGQYFAIQAGHPNEVNPWQRDMTDEGKMKADERHSGAPHVGLELEVEAEGPESRGSYRRHGEGRTTSDGRRGPDLWGFQATERRSKDEGRSFLEERHEDYEAKSAEATPVPMHRPQIAEGMSFRDPGYKTSSIDRPAVPENIRTSEEVERHLSEAKYETAADEAMSERRKKTEMKEAVSPSPSQRKPKKERKLLHFEESSSMSEDDEGSPCPSSTKKKTPKKIVKKPVERNEGSSRHDRYFG